MLLVVVASLVILLFPTGECDCLLKTPQGMVTLNEGNYSDGNTTYSWNLCSNLKNSNCSNSAVCQTSSSGAYKNCGTHINAIAARRSSGNSVLFQGGDLGCDYTLRSTLFFLHCSEEEASPLLVELEPCFYKVDLFSPLYCPAPAVVRDVKIGDFCEYIGQSLQFKDQSSKHEYDFNFCGGFGRQVKGCEGTHVCVRNRQTITGTPVILARKKKMIYTEERLNNDVATTYAIFTGGDRCPTNSSEKMSVLIYVGCKKSNAESIVHVTKNQRVCQEVFIYLVEELCPRPRFILSDAPPDFIAQTMPKHRVSEYVSKDVVKQIHEKPRNSLLALMAEKNDNDQGAPVKQRPMYFHSKGSPGSSFYGGLVGARDLAAERKQQHEKRASMRTHVPLPHHRFT